MAPELDRIIIQGEMSVTYSIKTVAGMTGLSAHTIRAWERRYGASEPIRSKTNRRVYSELDVARLKLLGQVVSAGHAISHVAMLTDDELKVLVTGASSPVNMSSSRADGEGSFLAACNDALARLNEEDLRSVLIRSTAELGVWGMLEEVVLPLVKVIEVRWSDGSMTIAEEHLASAMLRSFLDQTRATMTAPLKAPRLLVTTPKNQYHEIGALIVALVGALHHWNVTYLGPNLPAHEIANAVRKSGSRAVAISLVFPLDDPELPEELDKLRYELGEGFPILFGGRASDHYTEQISKIGGINVPNLTQFRDVLTLLDR